MATTITSPRVPTAAPSYSPKRLQRNSSPKDAEKRRGIRAFTKSFASAEEDNQGRVLLPANLREFAHIKKDVVFCGVGNRAELWAKEVYDEYFSGDDENYNEYFDSLGI